MLTPPGACPSFMRDTVFAAEPVRVGFHPELRDVFAQRRGRVGVASRHSWTTGRRWPRPGLRSDSPRSERRSTSRPASRRCSPRRRVGDEHVVEEDRRLGLPSSWSIGRTVTPGRAAGRGSRSARGGGRRSDRKIPKHQSANGARVLHIFARSAAAAVDARGRARKAASPCRARTAWAQMRQPSHPGQESVTLLGVPCSNKVGASRNSPFWLT